MVATKKERCYLASLLDNYSRRCVGWAVSNVNDTALTLAALNRAIESRQPQPGLRHHTNRGSNYTSGDYQQRLAKIGAVVSHSRPGRPQENGMVESFNKTISYEKLL
jgi:putative transposase